MGWTNPFSTNLFDIATSPVNVYGHMFRNTYKSSSGKSQRTSKTAIFKKPKWKSMHITIQNIKTKERMSFQVDRDEGAKIYGFYRKVGQNYYSNFFKPLWSFGKDKVKIVKITKR